MLRSEDCGLPVGIVSVCVCRYTPLQTRLQDNQSFAIQEDELAFCDLVVFYPYSYPGGTRFVASVIASGFASGFASASDVLSRPIAATRDRGPPSWRVIPKRPLHNRLSFIVITHIGYHCNLTRRDALRRVRCRVRYCVQFYSRIQSWPR